MRDIKVQQVWRGQLEVVSLMLSSRHLLDFQEVMWNRQVGRQVWGSEEKSSLDINLRIISKPLTFKAM